MTTEAEPTVEEQVALLIAGWRRAGDARGTALAIEQVLMRNVDPEAELRGEALSAILARG